MNLNKTLFYLFFSIVFSLSGNAQTKYETQIIKPSIKTLKAYVEGNERSYPAIKLNGDTKIRIQFDELATRSQNYSYQIIHCNYDWSESGLFTEEYMDGFNENLIQNYEYSNQTKVAYVNYWVLLPSDDVQFKVSGNYLLYVFENGNRDKPVLTARFVIYETIVEVNAEVIRPLGAKIQDNSQEIRMSVFHDQIKISDPFNDLKIVIAQNNRPNKELINIKPVFVKNNELVYSFSGENIMLGGNEFRTFGFTNIHRIGLNINDIKYVDTIYHVQLRLDERRSSKRYFWEEEMNGKNIIYIENSYDPNVSADYAWIYFSLPIEEPFLEGKVYVTGEMTGWRISKNNEMHYNFDTKVYEGAILLKQGYYDYMYTYYNNYTMETDDAFLEGSHYQTENDYIIYVYHKGFSDKFDRIIGYQVVNSKYQN